MKSIFSVLALFVTFLGQAQLTSHVLVHGGYVYQNQSFVDLGARVLILNRDRVLYRVGASAVLGVTKGAFSLMPKAQTDVLISFERNRDIHHATYLLAGAEMTHKYIAPKAGVSFFGLLDFTAGYAFSIGEGQLNGKKMQGLNLNATLNIPWVYMKDKIKRK